MVMKKVYVLNNSPHMGIAFLCMGIKFPPMGIKFPFMGTDLSRPSANSAHRGVNAISFPGWEGSWG
jgi:hypothetical protein